MKKNKYFIAFCFVFISFSPVFSQYNMAQFRTYFQEARFDYLHVYSEWNSNEAEYPPGSIFDYNGKKIDKGYYAWFHAQIVAIKDPLYGAEPDFYAGVYRFLLSARSEVFVIRGHEQSMREQPVYYVVYDRVLQKFTQAFEVSNFFGYESAFGNRESWLIDLNEDGVLDILTRSWIETTTLLPNQEVKMTEVDTLTAYIWKNDQFIKKSVNHLTFLKNTFELRVLPSLGYEDQKKLTLFLDGKLYENKRQTHFLVLGETKILKDAVTRQQQLGYFTTSKYNYLAEHTIDIYYHNGYYFTVMSGFSTKNEIDLALIEAQEKIDKQVYIQVESEWCTQRMEINCVDKKPCYYICK